ncbi:DUF456 domain-containing protein [Halopiger aswanensis]|uniref:DUF456 domain-containing protein n=1 Tax=Halopiger aswanensis TaxID=148449 RepID=A0A419WHI0_9EURY|nr:DUF456 domain-containing protein [Halopiger aswanensis]RKD94970.1 hypothetical protein ATJ93_1817 [Halopiger aswanensis]
MVDAITVVAVALLVGGVLGTVLPLVPGGALSLAGVFLYWWHTGFTEPGAITVVTLAILGATAMLVELFGGSIAARAGGASWTTTAAAAVVGIALMIVTGPLGLLAGLFGTVFVLEFARERTVDHSARSAIYTTIGVLASTAVEALLTASVLFGFLIAVFLF